MAFCTLHRSACQEVVRKTTKVDIELGPQWLLMGQTELCAFKNLPLVLCKVMASHMVCYVYNYECLVFYDLFSLITTSLNVMAKEG